MEFSFTDIQIGDVVDGTVINVSDNELTLDLNYAFEGTIYINEYTTEKIDSFKKIIAEGDIVRAVVKKINEEHAQVLLSRLGLIKEENFEKIKEIFKNEEVIQAKVTQVVNKGLLLSYLGFELFMHESQVSLDETPLDEFVGQTLEFKISDLDEQKQRIRVSRKSLLIEAEKAARKAEFESFQVGDVVEGKVKDLRPFGAIIEFEYNSGVLPLGEISHYRVENAATELKVGETLELKITEVGMKKGRTRISLSRKALLPTPIEVYAEENKVGSTVTGKVINKLPFGIIMELGKDVTGLLHNSEISWNPNDNFAASVVFGDEVEVHILSIDTKKNRIALSKKFLEDNPWAKVTVKYGDIVEGTISEVVIGKGYMVTVQGVEAFLDAREVTDENIGKLEDYYSIGEKIEAKVIKAYLNEWKIELSVKAVKNERERKQFDEYIKTQETRSVTLGDLFKDVLDKKK
jgi:small subunit ribosomal protein S1